MRIDRESCGASLCLTSKKVDAPVDAKSRARLVLPHWRGPSRAVMGERPFAVDKRVRKVDLRMCIACQCAMQSRMRAPTLHEYDRGPFPAAVPGSLPGEQPPEDIDVDGDRGEGADLPPLAGRPARAD